MPTPKQLEQLAFTRGWSYRQLALAIRDASGIDVHERTLARYCRAEFKPSRRLQSALKQFWAKRDQAEASSR